MEIGIRGKVELHIVDQSNDEVAAILSSNLVTRYGIEHFYSPCEVGDVAVTGLALGYREGEALDSDDIVPITQLYIENPHHPAESRLSSNSSSTWNTTPVNNLQFRWNFSMNNVPEGTVINHCGLVYEDADGVKHYLTSLKFKSKTGSDLTYTFDRPNMKIVCKYFIITNTVPYSSSTGQIRTIGHTLSRNRSQDNVPPENVYTRYPKTYYENVLESGTTFEDLAYINPGDGVWLSDEHYQQKYIIKSPPRAIHNTIRYLFFTLRLGTLLVSVYYSDNSTKQVDLTLNVRTLVELDPRPITGITYLGSNVTGPILISSPPYQWVELFLGNQHLSTLYIGADGAARTIEDYYTVVDPITNSQVRQYPYTSGYLLSARVHTAKGTLVHTITTPDIRSNDVRAMYWLTPTVLRIVSNYMDRIDLYRDNLAYQDVQPQNTRGTSYFGVCENVFDEDPEYYYCDVTIPDYDPVIHNGLSYKVTDTAGNVYGRESSLHTGLLNYTGRNYTNTVKHGISSIDISTYNPTSITEYKFSVRVLEGDIT